MSKCFCRQPQLVLLLDRTEVCSCDERWRHEMEARELFQLSPSEQQRRLSGIDAARGKHDPAAGRRARMRLEDTLFELKQRRDAARAQVAAMRTRR